MKINKLFLITGLTLSITSFAWSKPLENNQITPVLKAKLSDKILTEAEIMQGVDRSQMLYQYCIQDTASKLKRMYPEVDQSIVIESVNYACEFPEDYFNIYSVLLASSSMKKPMSEKAASVFIEVNYTKAGRNQANAAQREHIYKNLGLLK